MKTAIWVRKAPEEMREELSKRIVENEDLFELFSKVCEEKINASRKKQLSEETYNLPAWSEKQADSNGYQRAMFEVVTLLKLRNNSDHE